MKVKFIDVECSEVFEFDDGVDDKQIHYEFIRWILDGKDCGWEVIGEES